MGFNYYREDPSKKEFENGEHQSNDCLSKSGSSSRCTYQMNAFTQTGHSIKGMLTTSEVEEVLKPKDLSFGKKVPISLVPPHFIREIARCMEDGAKKRSAYNWRSSKISAMQTLDKVLRHVLDCIDGEDLTEDSKLSNLASAAADIAVYLDAQKYGALVDDRPSKKDA